MSMKRFFQAVGLMIVVLWPWRGEPALAAEPRIALVIGNSAYEAAPPLANPANDATLLAETLRGLDFDVVELIDADRKSILLAAFDLRRRLKTAGGDAVGVFYYAGYGVQVAGENYFIPLGTEFKRPGDVPAKSVSAGFILQMMETAGNRLNFFVFDASRDTPFPASGGAETRGLALMSPLTGSLIASSTGPGVVTADGAATNSPYAMALSEAMRTPGVTGEQLFKRVRQLVLEATNDRQTTWEESSLRGAAFYFSDDVTLTTAEKEARRQAEEEARRLAAAEAEAERLAAEEEARRQAEAEAEAERLAAEEEARRLAEAEAQRLVEEAEAQRLAAEQAEAEAEAERLAAAEARETEVASLDQPCEDPLQKMFVDLPDADVPKAMACFSGIWEGKWGGVLCSSLAITSIDRGGMVKVVYSWGSGKKFGAGMWPYRGVIRDGKLRFGERSRSIFVFHINPEGYLEGIRETEGLKAFVRMQKCPPTKCL
jgi:uncharacterized caspase-like protein